MKINKVTFAVAFINWLVLLALTIFLLPSTVPIHINFSGQIDGLGTKWLIPIFSAVPALLSFGFYLYQKKREDGKTRSKNTRVEDIIVPILCLTFVVLTWMQYGLATMQQLGRDVTWLPLVIGGVFGALSCIIGNYESAVNRNHFFGIRTPWTQKNEMVWKKTHRISAYITIACGILVFIAGLISFITGNNIYLMIGLVIMLSGAAIFPVLYSYFLYRKTIK